MLADHLLASMNVACSGIPKAMVDVPLRHVPATDPWNERPNGVACEWQCEVVPWNEQALVKGARLSVALQILSLGSPTAVLQPSEPSASHRHPIPSSAVRSTHPRELLSSFNPSTSQVPVAAQQSKPFHRLPYSQNGQAAITVQSICSGKSASRSPRVPQQQGLSIPT